MTAFTEKVAEMRRLQKKYFSERSGIVLQQCKKAEKEVDLELARMAQARATEQQTINF